MYLRTPPTLLTAALLALTLVACGGGPPRIVGVVLDEDGVPIHKAEVETDPPSDPELSDEKGRFFIDRVLPPDGAPQPLPGGDYTLIVNKRPDYETTRQPIEVDGETEVTVRLKKKVADIGAPVAPEPTPEKPRGPGEPDPPVSGQ